MTKLKMRHTALSDVPQPELPLGYVLRHSDAHDREELVRLFQLGNLGIETIEDLETKFESHESYRPDHVLVVEHDNKLAGTASAFIDREDRTQGFLHMLSVDPQHRGRSLGRLLVLAVLRMHADLGLSQQWMWTEGSRLVAIRLYLSLGYVPAIESEDDRRRWAEVERQMVETQSHRSTDR